MHFWRVYLQENITATTSTAIRSVNLILIIIGQYAIPAPEGSSVKRLKAVAKDTPSEQKVALVCRDQSVIATIRDVFGDELLGLINVFSDFPDAGLKSINSVRSYIIVVDASAMKDELNRTSPGTPYIDLLNTARETAGKSICIRIIPLFGSFESWGMIR